MAVTVNSIESGGNILPVELVAYDMDGQEGLFVPNTAERTAMKEAAANIGGSFSRWSTRRWPGARPCRRIL